MGSRIEDPPSPSYGGQARTRTNASRRSNVLEKTPLASGGAVHNLAHEGAENMAGALLILA